MMFVVRIERASALLLVIASIQIHLALGQLVVLSECTCPGRELRLECTVVGGVSTTWRGTPFKCPGQGNETILRHSLFVSGTAFECPNEIIIGRSQNRTFDGPNSTFTSQLIIHLPLLNSTSTTLEGETVQCFHDGVTVIGNHTIAYTRIPNAPPPNNIHLAQVSRKVLNFQWDPVQLVCSDIEYKVIATNCGICPDTTVNASVICVVRDIDLFTSTNNTNGTVCTLSVETAVCGFQSNMSEAATALLKAPDRPNINKVLPYYNFSSRQIIRIDIQIESDEERFYISEGINGSVTSYTFDISFSDSESNCTSPTAVVPVSSCVAGACTITLTNLTSLPCYVLPSQAEVAVYASNVLTDGPPSKTPLLNTSNSLFSIEYEQLSNIFSCRFVESYENKSCEITYGAMDPTDQTCAMDNRRVNSRNDQMSDTVIVFIPSLAQAKPATYCFTAIGKTPTFTLAVEGTFTIDSSTSGITNTTVILIAVISSVSCVIIILLLCFIAVLSRIISKKKHTLKQREYTDQDKQQYDRTTFAQRQLKRVPSTHSEQTDEQQYNQIAHQQCRNSKVSSTHLDQSEEQQYDQIFIQKQSKQPEPIANQQMVYSELGPTITGKKTSNFVLESDDRIEYAELDHKLHDHSAPPPLDTARTVTSCLTTPPDVGHSFGFREDSPPPPPLPPKYTMM